MATHLEIEISPYEIEAMTISAKEIKTILCYLKTFIINIDLDMLISDFSAGTLLIWPALGK